MYPFLIETFTPFYSFMNKSPPALGYTLLDEATRPVRGMNYGVPLGILCGKQKKNPALRDSPPADNPQQRHHSNDLSLLLACLVAHCAGRLTCGLAGCLALAASALLQTIVHGLCI